MFQRKHIKINGVELPEEFSGSSIINNVAISNDGKRYAAVTRNGHLITADIPSDGKIEVDRTVIQYNAKSPTENLSDFFNDQHRRHLGESFGDRVRASFGEGVKASFDGVKASFDSGVRASFGQSVSMSRGSIIMSGNGVNISMGGNPLEYEIDETYDVKEGDEISLNTKNESISLGIRDGNQVRLSGLVASKPEYTRVRLSIGDFDGKLELPRGISRLELALETKNGSVNGEIMHPGYVETKNGSIVLMLYAPLIVDASTKNGSVNVVGMESQGNGRYAPIGVNSVGKLRASTKNGSVLVNYIKR